MKKSLIALAVAGVFAAPVAMAETTVYGTANVSYDAVNSGSGGISANQISSNSSSIGFKGSEDLGGGTSAIFQVESMIAIDAGFGGWAWNSTYAGLSGADWGTLIMGNPATPYKSATRGLDLFADTIADNRSLTGPFDGTNQFGTAPNTVAYMSPNMGGFSVAAAIIAGAENVTTGTQVKGSGYSLSGTYGAGPLNAFLAYQSVTVGSVGSGLLGVSSIPALVGPLSVNDKLTAWTLGGSYTMDAFQVNLSYEKRTWDQAAGSNDQADWYLAGKFNVSSSDAVKLAYTRANDIGGLGCGCNDTGASQISVGYDHGLSKNTTVYALYTQLSNKAKASYGMGGYDGITAGVSPFTSDSDPHAFSIGMKHNF